MSFNLGHRLIMTKKAKSQKYFYALKYSIMLKNIVLLINDQHDIMVNLVKPRGRDILAKT